MKNVKQLIVDTIAEAVKIPLTLIDVDFGVPVRMPHGSARNTKVRVFPKPWIGSSGSYELAYNRMHSSDVRYFTIKKSNAVTTHEVLEELNYKYGYDFELEDVIDRALPQADQDGDVSFYLQFTEASVGCYGGSVVRTNTEHIDTQNPLPTPPDNPSDPAPVITPYPPVNTLIKTECRDGEMWLYRSDGNGGLVQSMGSANHPECQTLTLKVSKTEDVTTGVTAINYTFNKETPSVVTLTYSITPGTGDASMIAGIEYKTRDGLLWTTPGIGRSITIPQGTRSFYVRYTPRTNSAIPVDGLTVNVLLSEKSPGVSITVTEPLSTEITIMPVTVDDSTPTVPTPPPSPTPPPPPASDPIFITAISSYDGSRQLMQGTSAHNLITFSTPTISPFDLTFSASADIMTYVNSAQLRMYDLYETLIDTVSLNFTNNNTPKVTIPIDVQSMQLSVESTPGAVVTPTDVQITADTDSTNLQYVTTEDPLLTQKVFQIVSKYTIHRDYSTLTALVPTDYNLSQTSTITLDGIEYFAVFNVVFKRRMLQETVVYARVSMGGDRDSIQCMWTNQYTNPLTAPYGTPVTILTDETKVYAVTLPAGSCGFHMKVRPLSVHTVPAQSYARLELITGTNTDIEANPLNAINMDLTELISDGTGTPPTEGFPVWTGCVVAGNRYDYRQQKSNGAGGVNAEPTFGNYDNPNCGYHYLNTIGHHARTWGTGEMTNITGHILPISSQFLRWRAVNDLIPLPMITDTIGGSAGTMQLQSPAGLGQIRIKPITQNGVTSYVAGLNKFFFLSKLEEVFGMPSSESFEIDLGVPDGPGQLLTVPTDRPPIGNYRNGVPGTNVLVEWNYTSDFVRDQGSNRPSHTIDSNGNVTFTLENSDHLTDKTYNFTIALSNELGTQSLNVVTHSLTVPRKDNAGDPVATLTIDIPWSHAFKGVWVY